LRSAKKIGNAHVFEALVSRAAIQGRFVDKLLSLFGWRMRPVMSRAGGNRSGRIS
jgi:hypothetical protein